MSDTPLTDAAKEGGESWMELAALSAVLERENAALRLALDQQANYQRELRADRDRLDWLGIACSCDFSWVGRQAPASALTSLRSAIDWAMKEEQS